MKNKKGIILSIILIVIGIAIIVLNMILKNYDWYLRDWVILLASFIIPIGIMTLVICLIKKLKTKILKIFFITIWILLCLIVMFVEFVFLSSFIKFNIIKEIDGVEYLGVEYYSNRLSKTVIYYEKYNIFAYHKTEEYIEEFYNYDDYEHPEYRKYYKIPITDSIIYYYDKDGNITDIKRYNENDVLGDVNKEIQYNQSYGEIFKIENNTIYYGDVKENESDYLSQKIPENSKIINYENEEIISVNDIEVGDYITLYVPTPESINAQAIIIVAKKDYIINQIENQLLHKKEFNGNLDYYNESENYITVEIALENKTIENMPVQPMYYLDLRVGDNTETYLGWKEDNPNSNYGYHVHELCTIELETEITDLSNKYIVKSIEFIAD